MNRSAFFIFCLAATACSKQEEMLPAHDASVPVHINEVFAAGGSKHDADEHAPGDWLELYNAGPSVRLDEGAWFLTDDREDLLKFELPAVLLDEQQHRRIWCDGGDGPEIHAPFRLSSKGEWLALVRLKDGRPAIVDSVHYAAQTRRRMSTSRIPDGATTWVKGSIATPGATNAPGSTAVHLAEE